MLSDIPMPGSMDGLKLAHAVHARWPSIKIILVSGRIHVSDSQKSSESRFFGKYIADRQIIAKLQDRLGDGALRIVFPPSSADNALERTIESLSAEQEILTAENDDLRLLLEQTGIDAETLRAQADIDAKEREAADKLQKLILEEMHHRIKSTLATVGAIALQSLRTATCLEAPLSSLTQRP